MCIMMISLGFQVQEKFRGWLIEKNFLKPDYLKITGLAFPSTAKVFIDKPIAMMSGPVL